MAKGNGSGGAKRKNLVLWGLIGAVLVVTIGVVLLIFMNLVRTETYYVLTEDTPTRTEITPDMLTPIPVNDGSAPPAALSISDVQNGSIFTKYSLLAGETLTESNTGGREDISVGIPDEWVITSFGVDADSAVGGRVQRGYYFDLMVATGDGSYYPFVNVLALDTTVSLSGASNANAADTAEAKEGMTSQYVVGMTPQNAAKLQQIMTKYSSSVKLVLSPRQNEYAKPRMDDYTGVFAFQEGDAPTNMGEGTDYTFTSLKRDEFGRPIEELDNCSDGNSIVTGDVCATKDKDSASSDETVLIYIDDLTGDEIIVAENEEIPVNATLEFEGTIADWEARNNEGVETQE